ncbi:MAG: GYF domain-containing protein [Chthoniobacterales bacterium]
MQIYIGKNGQQLGPFSLEEVNRKVAEGSFAGTDLAWYEGAAGWAPLSAVPGVVIPQAPASTSPPIPVSTPAPTPAPVQPATVIAPTRPNASIVQPAKSPTRTLSMISWILLGITLVVSFIPLVGCGSWILVWPVAITAIILGIIIMTRGRTGQGILIILAAIVVVPIALIAPVISTALLGGGDRAKETVIMENLRSIDLAKTQFSVDKNPTTGTPVTMASLTSYFGGKEIKPVVGETYDPMPVGQAPTATLPANKTLGSFSGGDVLTVASIQTALANSLSWSSTTTKLPWSKGGTSPTPTAAPTSSPKASTEPNVTAVPKPSVLPKSSGTPHSLISPRQREEPEEPPSSRPSPSAKFAPPQKRSQTSPPQPPSEPEDSSGLRHGRQKPSESQSDESPSPSPDDDDD